MDKMQYMSKGGGVENKPNPTKSVFKPLIASSLALALGFSVASADACVNASGTTTPIFCTTTNGTLGSPLSLSGVNWNGSDGGGNASFWTLVKDTSPLNITLQFNTSASNELNSAQDTYIISQNGEIGTTPNSPILQLSSTTRGINIQGKILTFDFLPTDQTSNSNWNDSDGTNKRKMILSLTGTTQENGKSISLKGDILIKAGMGINKDDSNSSIRPDYRNRVNTNEFEATFGGDMIGNITIDASDVKDLKIPTRVGTTNTYYGADKASGYRDMQSTFTFTSGSLQGNILTHTGINTFNFGGNSAYIIGDITADNGYTATGNGEKAGSANQYLGAINKINFNGSGTATIEGNILASESGQNIITFDLNTNAVISGNITSGVISPNDIGSSNVNHNNLIIFKGNTAKIGDEKSSVALKIENVNENIKNGFRKLSNNTILFDTQNNLLYLSEMSIKGDTGGSYPTNKTFNLLNFSNGNNTVKIDSINSARGMSFIGKGLVNDIQIGNSTLTLNNESYYNDLLFEKIKYEAIYENSSIKTDVIKVKDNIATEFAKTEYMANGDYTFGSINAEGTFSESAGNYINVRNASITGKISAISPNKQSANSTNMIIAQTLIIDIGTEDAIYSQIGTNNITILQKGSITGNIKYEGGGNYNKSNKITFKNGGEINGNIITLTNGNGYLDTSSNIILFEGSNNATITGEITSKDGGSNYGNNITFSGSGTNTLKNGSVNANYDSPRGSTGRNYIVFSNASATNIIDNTQIQATGGNNTIILNGTSNTLTGNISSTGGKNTISFGNASSTTNALNGDISSLTSGGSDAYNTITISKDITFGKAMTIETGDKTGGGYGNTKNIISIAQTTTFNNNVSIITYRNDSFDRSESNQNILKFGGDVSFASGKKIAELSVARGNIAGPENNNEAIYANILSFNGSGTQNITIGDINKQSTINSYGSSTGSNYIGKEITQGNDDALTLNSAIFSNNDWKNNAYQANVHLNVTGEIYSSGGTNRPSANRINVLSLTANTITANSNGSNNIITGSGGSNSISGNIVANSGQNIITLNGSANTILGNISNNAGTNTIDAGSQSLTLGSQSNKITILTNGGANATTSITTSGVLTAYITSMTAGEHANGNKTNTITGGANSNLTIGTMSATQNANSYNTISVGANSSILVTGNITSSTGKNNFTFTGDSSTLTLKGATNQISTLTALDTASTGDTLILDGTLNANSTTIDTLTNGDKLIVNFNGKGENNGATLKISTLTGNTLKAVTLNANSTNNTLDLTPLSTAIIATGTNVDTNQELTIKIANAALTLTNGLTTTGKSTINAVGNSNSVNATLNGGNITASTLAITSASTSSSITFNGATNSFDTFVSDSASNSLTLGTTATSLTLGTTSNSTSENTPVTFGTITYGGNSAQTLSINGGTNTITTLTLGTLTDSNNTTDTLAIGGGSTTITNAITSDTNNNLTLQIGSSDSSKSASLTLSDTIKTANTGSGTAGVTNVIFTGGTDDQIHHSTLILTQANNTLSSVTSNAKNAILAFNDGAGATIDRITIQSDNLTTTNTNEGGSLVFAFNGSNNSQVNASNGINVGNGAIFGISLSGSGTKTINGNITFEENSTLLIDFANNNTANAVINFNDGTNSGTGAITIGEKRNSIINFHGTNTGTLNGDKITIDGGNNTINFLGSATMSGLKLKRGINTINVRDNGGLTGVEAVIADITASDGEGLGGVTNIINLESRATLKLGTNGDQILTSTDSTKPSTLNFIGDKTYLQGGFGASGDGIAIINVGEASASYVSGRITKNITNVNLNFQANESFLALAGNENTINTLTSTAKDGLLFLDAYQNSVKATIRDQIIIGGNKGAGSITFELNTDSANSAEVKLTNGIVVGNGGTLGISIEGSGEGKRIVSLGEGKQIEFQRGSTLKVNFGGGARGAAILGGATQVFNISEGSNSEFNFYYNTQATLTSGGINLVGGTNTVNFYGNGSTLSGINLTSGYNIINVITDEKGRENIMGIVNVGNIKKVANTINLEYRTTLNLKDETGVDGSGSIISSLTNTLNFIGDGAKLQGGFGATSATQGEATINIGGADKVAQINAVITGNVSNTKITFNTSNGTLTLQGAENTIKSLTGYTPTARNVAQQTINNTLLLDSDTNKATNPNGVKAILQHRVINDDVTLQFGTGGTAKTFVFAEANNDILAIDFARGANTNNTLAFTQGESKISQNIAVAPDNDLTLALGDTTTNNTLQTKIALNLVNGLNSTHGSTKIITQGTNSYAILKGGNIENANLAFKTTSSSHLSIQNTQASLATLDLSSTELGTLNLDASNSQSGVEASITSITQGEKLTIHFNGQFIETTDTKKEASLTLTQASTLKAITLGDNSTNNILKLTGGEININDKMSLGANQALSINLAGGNLTLKEGLENAGVIDFNFTTDSTIKGAITTITPAQQTPELSRVIAGEVGGSTSFNLGSGSESAITAKMDGAISFSDSSEYIFNVNATSATFKNGTAGTGLVFSNGINVINFNKEGSTLNWQDIDGSSQAIATNNGIAEINFSANNSTLSSGITTSGGETQIALLEGIANAKIASEISTSAGNTILSLSEGSTLTLANSNKQAQALNTSDTGQTTILAGNHSKILGNITTNGANGANADTTINLGELSKSEVSTSSTFTIDADTTATNGGIVTAQDGGVNTFNLNSDANTLIIKSLVATGSTAGGANQINLNQAGSINTISLTSASMSDKGLNSINFKADNITLGFDTSGSKDIATTLSIQAQNATLTTALSADSANDNITLSFDKANSSLTLTKGTTISNGGVISIAFNDTNNARLNLAGENGGDANYVFKSIDTSKANGATINLATSGGRDTDKTDIANFRLLSIGDHSSTKDDGLSGNLNAMLYVNKDTSITGQTLGGVSASQSNSTYGYAHSDRIIINDATAPSSLVLNVVPNLDQLLDLGYSGEGTQKEGNIALVTVAKDANVSVSTEKVTVGFEEVVAELQSETTDESGAINESGAYITYFLGGAKSMGASVETQEVASAALTVNYDLFLANFNSLNKRMGELRDNAHNQGVWARIFGGAMSNDFGAGSKTQYVTAQAGYDYSLSLGDARNYMGIALAYGTSSTKSNTLTQSGVIVGSTPNIGLDKVSSNMVEVGVYNSYVSDSGWYNDTIFKFDYIMSEFAMTNNLGQMSETNNFAVVLSDEFGYRYSFGVSEKGSWYIDPQAEFGLGWFNQSDFNRTLESNLTGTSTLKAMQDSILTLRSRAGLSLGKKFNTERGFASLYVGAFYEYDYIEGGNAEVSMGSGASNGLQSIESNGRAIINVGSNIELTEGARLYIDVEKSFGDKQRTHMQFNFGARYSFGERSATLSKQTQQRKEIAPLKVSEENASVQEDSQTNSQEQEENSTDKTQEEKKGE